MLSKGIQIQISLAIDRKRPNLGFKHEINTNN